MQAKILGGVHNQSGVLSCMYMMYIFKSLISHFVRGQILLSIWLFTTFYTAIPKF